MQDFLAVISVYCATSHSDYRMEGCKRALHTREIADQMIRARSVTEEAIAEAQSVRKEVESRMVEIL